MNGPDHYREAERLAELAHHFSYGDGGDATAGAALATEALAHATLALAAATALAPSQLGVRAAEWQDWQHTAGHHDRAGAEQKGNDHA